MERDNDLGEKRKSKVEKSSRERMGEKRGSGVRKCIIKQENLKKTIKRYIRVCKGEYTTIQQEKKKRDLALDRRVLEWRKRRERKLVRKWERCRFVKENIDIELEEINMAKEEKKLCMVHITLQRKVLG